MRFFFYGTLMAGSGHRLARRVEERMRRLGPAAARRLLHAIPDPGGWYPALVNGEGEVLGDLYEGALTAADLADFDRYEDYDPSCPEASLYLRREVPVMLPGGAGGRAQTYLFNQPLPEGSRLIAGGDFRAWLAATGYEPFRPV